ncbi:SURF1 family cytochrome oxidase biogenesis protein [Spelaeicoccus albus]|uniref:SURF1-like protein n=1 Tax=Spelaeicoccus albus TaxID=1280376 RepID=A0A7Z0IIJ4_9MICO|nr:SURF1 family protein [Spelaeicoccus albus]NYI68509.1 cytochrome oxidase assembly protein ShyY1 [Spelaeicoccus albus]
MNSDYRLIFNKRWLGYLAGAIVFAIACVGLGHWQLDRRAEKHAEVVRLNENYDSTPVAISSVLPRHGSDLPANSEWKRVKFTGTYDTDHTELARNRPLDGQSGYEVIVPFKLKGGGGILVDRGWVSTNKSGSAPSSVPQPEDGTVTVVARMQPSQSNTGQGSPQGQLTAIDPSDVHVDYPLYQGAYVLMQTESPAAQATPQPLPKPSISDGVNLSYAMQWFCFGIMALFAFVYSIRQEVRRRREDDELEAAMAESGEDFDKADIPIRPRTSSAERRQEETGRPTSNQVRQPKRRRTRRTAEDEEDEILARQGY